MDNRRLDFGKIIGILTVGALLGSLGLGTLIYFRTPAADITATVRYAPLIWPPELYEKNKELWDSAKEHSEEYFTDSVFFRNSLFHGLWIVEIRNQGSLLASSLSLKLPYAELFYVKKEGAEAETIEADEIVEIGDLRQLESTIVTAWATREPREFMKDDIRITHSSGVGAITVYSPVGPIWYWLSEHWLFYLWLSVLAVLIVLAIVATVLSDKEKQLDQKRNREKED